MKYQTAKFVLSAAKLTQLPSDEGQEVAFVGRSNAGKSSALNVLTQQKGLAKTSKTPGRTRLINVFELAEGARLVDLPGYGYAKVTQAEKKQWAALIEGYLQTRHSLVGLVLLMDIRHPLKPQDWQMITWAQHVRMPIHILLTKADKLKRGAQLSTAQSVSHALSLPKQDLITLQRFSALTREGLSEFVFSLDQWFDAVYDN